MFKAERTERQIILKVKSHSALTLVTPFISHEAIEDGQVAEEAAVEEEEEYDTDSDTDYPTADNDEEDSLDDLMFLRAVTTRSGRMVRVVYRECMKPLLSLSRFC